MPDYNKQTIETFISCPELLDFLQTTFETKLLTVSGPTECLALWPSFSKFHSGQPNDNSQEQKITPD